MVLYVQFIVGCFLNDVAGNSTVQTLPLPIKLTVSIVPAHLTLPSDALPLCTGAYPDSEIRKTLLVPLSSEGLSPHDGNEGEVRGLHHTVSLLSYRPNLVTDILPRRTRRNAEACIRVLLTHLNRAECRRSHRKVREMPS